MAAAGALGLTAPARAQQATFVLDRAQISGMPEDGLVVWRPYMPEKTRFYGAAALGYTLNPLRAGTLVNNSRIEQQMENVVQHQLTTYLAGGVQIANRFAVGVALPVYLVNTGGLDPARFGVGQGLDRGTAVGDLRFDARVKLYENDAQTLRLGVGGSVWAPTGNARRFAGDGTTTAFVYGTGEYDFGPFLLAGHLGPHFRPDRGILGEQGVLEITNELRWAAGAFIPLRENELRLGASLWGTTGIGTTRTGGDSTFFNGRNTDLEWLAEVRMDIHKESNLYFSGGGGTRLTAGYGAPDVRLLAMIGSHTMLTDTTPEQARARRKAPQVDMRDKDTDGDGYPDDIDMCPTEPEDGKPPDPTDGCPARSDRDGDGIPDDIDKCPDEPEDFDGIQDHDGCPETDADGDGIPDTEDACPLRKGVASKDPQKHGCPKDSKVIETEGGLTLLENIQFETGRAEIKPVSFPILDEVVEVLESRPDIRMGVYGHTDSVGGLGMNMQLSKNRAAAVMNYLAQKGIARKRLESDGFGPNQPIADNGSAEGRAKNRRVEFKIIE
jgi:OmpA-OmpF porin, OOP family